MQKMIFKPKYENFVKKMVPTFHIRHKFTEDPIDRQICRFKIQN